MPIEVDVHDVGVGTLTVKLAGIAGADGLLVRARTTARAAQRGGRSRSARRRWIGEKNELALVMDVLELGWDELTPPERTRAVANALASDGALRGARPPTSPRPRSPTPPPPIRESPPSREELGRVALSAATSASR